MDGTTRRKRRSARLDHPSGRLYVRSPVPRAVEQRQVAAVYRALAVTLRALGTEELAAARRGTVAALNLAFAELIGQRAAASGRDRELALLMSLIRPAPRPPRKPRRPSHSSSR